MNNDDHKYRGIPGKVWERVFEEIAEPGLGAAITKLARTLTGRARASRHG